MRIAVPVAAGCLCQHFGHCEEFQFFDVDEATGTVIEQTSLKPPAHEPGIIPPWVGGQGAQLVICGGMGARARMLFESAGVRVVIGAQGRDPRRLVQDWMAGALITGENACDEGRPSHTPRCG